MEGRLTAARLRRRVLQRDAHPTVPADTVPFELSEWCSAVSAWGAAAAARWWQPTLCTEPCACIDQVLTARRGDEHLKRGQLRL